MELIQFIALMKLPCMVWSSLYSRWLIDTSSEQPSIKQWLEGLGIDPITAGNYEQNLRHPDIDYTEVSQLVTINEQRLIDAGVRSARHRDIILQGSE